MYDESYLAHHGVKGQKWGVRRWKEKRGEQLYKKGHTIGLNDSKIASINKFGRIAGKVNSVGATIGLTYGAVTGKINIPYAFLTIPVASLAIDAGTRAAVNNFATPYRLQNANMRAYRNRDKLGINYVR